MKECNCIKGMMNGRWCILITKSKEKSLRDLIMTDYEAFNHSYGVTKGTHPKDYAKMGVVTNFNFCPLCGEKIERSK